MGVHSISPRILSPDLPMISPLKVGIYLGSSPFWTPSDSSVSTSFTALVSSGCTYWRAGNRNLEHCPWMVPLVRRFSFVVICVSPTMRVLCCFEYMILSGVPPTAIRLVRGRTSKIGSKVSLTRLVPSTQYRLLVMRSSLALQLHGVSCAIAMIVDW